MIKDILYEKAEQRLMEKELDPNKSVKLAKWTESDHTGGFRNDSETLYVSEKGEYYIVYEGGLSSGFHSLPGVEAWFGGTYIRTVSIEDAYNWCEETLNQDAIREHFPFFMISLSKKEKKE